MMVAITVFLFAVSTIIGLFIFGVRQQAKALSFQIMMDQTSFAMESMSRYLRLAWKQTNDLPVGCLSAFGKNYEITRAGAGIQFITSFESDAIMACEEIYLGSGKLQYRKKIGTAQEVTYDLTSLENVKINKLNFNVIGGDQTDALQPRITISMEFEGMKANDKTVLKIQTTVSQRLLDINIAP